MVVPSCITLVADSSVSLPAIGCIDVEVSAEVVRLQTIADGLDSYYTILYVCGTIVGAAGLAYVALHFVPMFEAPS